MRATYSFLNFRNRRRYFGETDVIYFRRGKNRARFGTKTSEIAKTFKTLNSEPAAQKTVQWDSKSSAKPAETLVTRTGPKSEKDVLTNILTYSSNYDFV